MKRYRAIFWARNYKALNWHTTGSVECDKLEQAKNLIRELAENKSLACDYLHAFIYDTKNEKYKSYSDRIVTEDKIYWTPWKILSF